MNKECPFISKLKHAYILKESVNIFVKATTTSIMPAFILFHQPDSIYHSS
jgi:hypothetical protein